MPPGMGILIGLRRLDLLSNDLDEFPAVLLDMPQMVCLDIGGCRLPRTNGKDSVRPPLTILADFLTKWRASEFCCAHTTVCASCPTAWGTCSWRHLTCRTTH